MATMIFGLLKTDYETLSQVPAGQGPPPPMLYDGVCPPLEQKVGIGI